VCGEQWFGKQRNGMLAEIRGHVADAKPPARRAIEVKRGVRRHQRQGVLLVPAPVLGKHLLGGNVWAVVEAEQDIAVRQSKIRTQGECLAQRSLCLGQATLAHQRET
jgi:hypothetical protein